MVDPVRHMEFHERQARASEELIASLVECIPHQWLTTELRLEANYSPYTQTRSIRHQLLNPATGEEINDFPERLFRATYSLHAVFVEFGQNWKGCVLKLTSDGHGKMSRCETNYRY